MAMEIIFLLFAVVSTHERFSPPQERSILMASIHIDRQQD